jgi:hypothetical protein
MRVAGPITVSRRSKTGHIHPTPTCIGATGLPKISKQPAPSHHRSPTRSQTVRGHGLGPIIASRRSKIGPINSPRQRACKSRCDRIPEVSKQPAPSHHRSPTRSQTVRGHGLGPITASRRQTTCTYVPLGEPGILVHFPLSPLAVYSCVKTDMHCGNPGQQAVLKTHRASRTGKPTATPDPRRAAGRPKADPQRPPVCCQWDLAASASGLSHAAPGWAQADLNGL